MPLQEMRIFGAGQPQAQGGAVPPGEELEEEIFHGIRCPSRFEGRPQFDGEMTPQMLYTLLMFYMWRLLRERNLQARGPPGSDELNCLLPRGRNRAPQTGRGGSPMPSFLKLAEV